MTSPGTNACCRHRLAVHPGAAARIQVEDHIPAAHQPQLSVRARDARVIDHQLVIRSSPDIDHRLLKREYPCAVHNQERSFRSFRLAAGRGRHIAGLRDSRSVVLGRHPHLAGRQRRIHPHLQERTGRETHARFAPARPQRRLQLFQPARVFEQLHLARADEQNQLLWRGHLSVRFHMQPIPHRLQQPPGQQLRDLRPGEQPPGRSLYHCLQAPLDLRQPRLDWS